MKVVAEEIDVSRYVELCGMQAGRVAVDTNKFGVRPEDRTSLVQTLRAFGKIETRSVKIDTSGLLTCKVAAGLYTGERLKRHLRAVTESILGAVHNKGLNPGPGARRRSTNDTAYVRVVPQARAH